MDSKDDLITQLRFHYNIVEDKAKRIRNYKFKYFIDEGQSIAIHHIQKYTRVHLKPSNSVLSVKE